MVTRHLYLLEKFSNSLRTNSHSVGVIRPRSSDKMCVRFGRPIDVLLVLGVFDQ